MKTKIIATIGPASSSRKMLKQLKRNGMGIARISLKYASAKETAIAIEKIKKTGCKVMIDLNDWKSEKGFLKKDYFDFLAVSFSESARQLQEIRKAFAPRKIFLVSKIESEKGLSNIHEIIRESDGVMVARGDLGKNVPIAKLPLYQKRIIRECNEKKKMAITATEMLLSMTESKIPERAEVSDVANAVLDGSNALMLSEETAIGKYPVLAVKMMAEIIKETEKHRKEMEKKSHV